MQVLKLYNTYTKKIVDFQAINPPLVGIYVCGPTVYGHPHLGHARGPIVFDVLHRYLNHLGYKVRFVRNVTDVGHLVNDGDDGDDKVAKKAKLEQLEPMEIAQFYTDSYHLMLQQLNVLPASIEPRASGHIIEQIEMIQTIIENGFAYEANGSVYFDVIKYSKTNEYGKLSGRILDDLIAGAGNDSRELEGQNEKRNANDFALWKKASQEHIMQWSSPWGKGFPGWHIECSAMSKKYLGSTFDIHGGGMDLLFPHHESEIAQSVACSHQSPANIWMHHNMITINGQKMAKSLNNGISMQDFFKGNSPLLEKAYSPMTLKFFVLQAHYRGTLDFSNQALIAAEKGLHRLMTAYTTLQTIKPTENSSDLNIESFQKRCFEALNEDLNTPILIATLFEMVTLINNLSSDTQSINSKEFDLLKNIYHSFVFDILGLANESNSNSQHLDGLMQLLIDIRHEAKIKKDYALSDEIRNKLITLGIQLKDGKDGTTFSLN
ncbi:MAG: cysteine--tRNA ligase [Bacteroidota bacterium]|nr:cysteine--tRNA ligase [Bacteroidota bacterium]